MAECDSLNLPKGGLMSSLTSPSQQVVLWPQHSAQVYSQQPLTTSHNMLWELKSFLLPQHVLATHNMLWSTWALLTKGLLVYFSPFFLANLGHRAYGPQKSGNYFFDFTVSCKIKEKIDWFLRSVGPMSQNRQKKWRKINEQALQQIHNILWGSTVVVDLLWVDLSTTVANLLWGVVVIDLSTLFMLLWFLSGLTRSCEGGCDSLVVNLLWV